MRTKNKVKKFKSKPLEAVVKSGDRLWTIKDILDPYWVSRVVRSVR